MEGIDKAIRSYEKLASMDLKQGIPEASIWEIQHAVVKVEQDLKTFTIDVTSIEKEVEKCKKSFQDLIDQTFLCNLCMKRFPKNEELMKQHRIEHINDATLISPPDVPN